MGNHLQNCINVTHSNLEMGGSFDAQSIGNLSAYPQSVPQPKYATRSAYCPQLNNKVSEVLTRQLQKQYFIQQDYRGYQFPPFFITHKQIYYQGQWLRGKPHGRGKIYFPSGSYFEGFFRQGQAYAKNAILIFNDGSFYRGEVEQSKLQGEGRFQAVGRVVYQGSWKDSMPWGKGKQMFADGNVYDGDFKQGLKQGRGSFRWKDGRVYQGEFKAGKMHGKGMLSKNNKQLFRGMWQDGIKTGEGKLVTAYGVYQGGFVGGEMSGRGRFKWTDGKVYQGMFQRGKMHGEGVIVFPDGQKVKGRWEQGVNIKVDEVSKANRK